MTADSSPLKTTHLDSSSPVSEFMDIPIVFFDVETSIPRKSGQGFALLEFGALVICPHRLVELACYSTLIRPSDLSVISEASVRCNGITRDSVSSAPDFQHVADQIYEILHGGLINCVVFFVWIIPLMVYLGWYFFKRESVG